MNVTRLDEKFIADPKRIILQHFSPGSVKRIDNVIERISKLSDEEVSHLLKEITDNYETRHRNFKKKLFANYDRIKARIKDKEVLSDERQLLLGAYFSKEYSVEAAALFNPSMVPHPDQSGLPAGSVRFIMSLRATGEGHISSIEFRSGIINDKDEIIMDDTSVYAETPVVDKNEVYAKEFIRNRVNFEPASSASLLNLIPDEFTKSGLEEILPKGSANEQDAKIIEETCAAVDANYIASFSHDSYLSERVFFPQSKSESVGMEDVRLVCFVEDDGSIRYYGTYSAYNGRTFGTHILETEDFIKFKIRTLHGKAVKDKGMAIFPRKINGKYYITSRQDGENLYIMSSDNLYFWDNYVSLAEPKYPWEFVQLGNCGSPIETEKGWLLIIHSVGPFRTYNLGAMLLDKDDPAKVIGTLKEPLLEPSEDEREGYVPNVVYSCGSMAKGDTLFVPYAMSDSKSGFVKVSIKELLSNIEA